jgi:murein DD-endopeptidase MepM/ murein hydrolase activator NlpD
MGEERWEPLGEVCVYPLDLLEDEGEVAVYRWVGGERRQARVRIGEYPYPVQHIEIADEGKVNLSAEDLARAQREGARVEALWELRTPRRFTLPLAPPLADLPAGGRFGSRRFFNGEPRSPHTGADYGAAAGTPVMAVADGRVVLAADHFFSGKSVFLDHGDGLVSMYFHLAGLAVEEGEEVGRGEIVGTVGATGRATGPHLHVGLRWRGARVDPAQLLAPLETLPTVDD